jgi:MIP family channel proteins
VQERGPAAYIAEFIGTFALVFFVCMAVSLFNVPATQTAPNPYIDWGVIGLVHVFVLFLLIQSLAIASGAHFNPAVTTVMVALRKISPADAGIYAVCQFAGGVAAALLTKGLLLDEGEPNNYGAVGLNPRIDEAIFPGMVVEFLGTFFLVWAIVAVAVNPSGAKDWAGFTIGATLGFLVMVLGPLTGAGFNPARAFGPALVAKEFNGADTFLLVYVLAPVLGALAAGLAYYKLYITPGAKEPGGMGPVG